MTNQNHPPFEIGICMAGAVSAGAYTAGVMDFLIQALDEWEKRKVEDPENTPLHDVVIPVLGGASAGGMTSIITANAIQQEIDPVKTIADIENGRKRNKIFNAWVNLTHDEMFPELLNNSDLKEGKVTSIFNSTFIDQIAAKTLIPNEDLKYIKRNYFAEELKVFTTLTNLNGIHFKQEFTSDSDQSSYHISKHSDFACFEITDQAYKGKGWMPLNFKDEKQRKIAIDAAMATGAFPVGLRARKVVRPSQQVADSIFHQDVEMDTTNPLFETLNIDGGTINNEPYEKVQQVLAKGRELEKSYSKATSTVLMIDPFPSEEPAPKKMNDQVENIVGATLTAMINHLRFEPKSMSDSNNPDDASVYLIAPVRYKKEGNKEKKIEGKEAIACGFFQGFGGFIHKDFRLHDYFLGRANCEKFLRQHFTIPVADSNSIINGGYEHLKESNAFLVKNKRDGREEYPIIPLFFDEKAMYMPDFNGSSWPKMKEKDVNKFKKPLRRRFSKIIMNLMEMGFVGKAFLWIGTHVVLKNMATKKFLAVIKKDMEDWDLLKKE